MMDEQTPDVAESTAAPLLPVVEPNVITHPLQAIDADETSVEPVKEETESNAGPSNLEAAPMSTPAVDPSLDAETPSEQPSLRTKLLPHRQKKKQPKRGILKAPPPPVKPGLGGKLRDALGSIHPKFLDYAVGPIGNGTAASVAESIPPSISVPVNNLASNVMEGVGVVGGAAAAVVGSWGGRFGKLVGAAAGTSGADNGAAGSPAPASLPWRFATRITGAASSSPVANPMASSRTDKELPTTPTKSLGLTSSGPGSPLQISNESTTITIITDTYRPLKRASFILPAISITYPISSANPPWSDKVLQDRRQVEESATRMMQSSVGAGFWNGEKLVELYEIACAGREESARAGIKQALLVSMMPPIAEFATDGSLQAISSADKAGQRQLLLTSGRAGARTAFVNVDPPLGKYAAQAFADVLSVEWGLAKLALQDGVLDHDEVRIGIRQRSRA
jgi:protein phosphatase 1 regulatory subunit 37